MRKMYIGLINAKIKTASPNTRYRIHCTNPINVNMAISRWHPKKKNNLLLPVLWDTSATLDTPSHKNRSDPAAAPPRSTHTPPRGHGTARWPFSLPKSSHACPSQGNLLNGQNWLSARGEFRATRKQRYRPWSRLLEQGTVACATGRPTSQAVSGGVKARATAVGATWSASTVRRHGAESELPHMLHGLRRLRPSVTQATR